MNVFVLSTGRSGSATICLAFRHATNYTSGHETESGSLYALDYSDQHIESDNRLAWMLGELGQKYPFAKYIHLIRNQDEVAKSIARRPDYPGESAVGFGAAILGTHFDRYEAASRVWEMKNTNISEFLAHKPHETVWLQDLTRLFPALWGWLGCEGDLDAAVEETKIRHNAYIEEDYETE